jgi:hypothetical protein
LVVKFLLEGATGWLADHSPAIQALASVANVILAGVLVWTTIRYARITADILEESRKSRLAAEQQVKAAESQASASRSQASAAYETLRLLREELQLGPSIVQSAIASAISSIEYWKSLDVVRLASVRGLPTTNDLVPLSAGIATDHARRISLQGAQLLSNAWDELRRAKDEIDRVTELGRAHGTGLTSLTTVNFHGGHHLGEALRLLIETQKHLMHTR